MVPSKGIPETAISSLGYAPLDAMHSSSRLLLVGLLMPFCHNNVYDVHRPASGLVGSGCGFLVFVVTLPQLFRGWLGQWPGV